MQKPPFAETTTRVSMAIPETEVMPVNLGTVHQQLLEEYAPPSLFTNENFHILHLSDRAGRYLQMSGGQPSAHLLKLIRPELHAALRLALYEVKQQHTPVQTSQLHVTIEGKNESLFLEVRPVLHRETTQWLILVLFKQVGKEEPPPTVTYEAHDRVITQLEKEVERLKDYIREAAQRFEIQTSELRSSNEELQALNEECLSVAEELQTSRDAVMADNDLPFSTNQKLRTSLEEMATVRNDLDNLIQSSNIGTLFLDRNLHIAQYTPVMAEIFDLVPADSGRHLSHITHRLHYSGLLEDAETVLYKFNEIEKEVRAGNGQVYLARLSPYRTRDNRISGVVMTFFDITKRKQAEEALRLSEEKYRIQLEQEVMQRTSELKESKDLLQSVVDTSLVQLSLLQAVRDEQNQIVDFRIMLVNRELERETGRSDLVGKLYAAEYPGIKQMGLFDLMLQVMETGQPAMEEYYYTYDGLNEWYSSMFVKVDDGLVATNQNITVRKEAEKEMLKILTLLQQTEELTKAGSWEYDMHTKGMLWSKGMYNIFEMEQGVSVYPSIYLDRVLKEDRQLAEKLVDSMQGGYEGVDQVMRLDFHGNIKTVKIKSVPLYNKEGKVEKILGIDLDISASIRAEEELKLQHQQLSENRAQLKKKDEFIGVASHELKTPVTSIKAYAEILQENFENSDDEMSALLMQKLNLQVDRLIYLINNLLDTTKISEGTLLLSPTRFDLNTLITERAEELQHTSAKHTLMLQLEELEPVVADKERISQVLTNLISNAIKYSPQGGEVLISTRRSAGNIEVSVRDRGIGISVESLSRVFDRFFRVDDALTKNYPGMGLGLFISAAIIHRHGGKIWAESAPSKGSVFFFALPPAGSQ